MANSMSDLNEILHNNLKVLANKELTGEELQQEISRSEAIAKVSCQIIKGAELTLRASEIAADRGANLKLEMFGEE